MEGDFKYLFGPVFSRRLGVSLGVDLLPYKTCTLDCVYCECGSTIDLVTSVAEYVSTEDVKSELNLYLSSCPKIDVITFSGAGEPTLHSGLGEIVRYIKENFFGYPVAVITNGTLLNIPSVRDGLQEADIVMTSFDALDEDIFFSVNRPHKDIRIQDMKDGLIEFKKSYKGKLWLEIFVIPDINDKKDHLDKLRDFINIVKPDRIQLNSLDRPGAETWVKPADADSLAAISSYLEKSEIINSYEIKKNTVTVFSENSHEKVMNAISRRPCTLEEIFKITGQSRSVVEDILSELISEGLVKADFMARGIFYSAV